MSKIALLNIAYLLATFTNISRMSCNLAITNFSDVRCGKQTIRYSRIVGGIKAEPGEFPWIVSVRRKGGHICGGVVVNKRWILTAAHCFCSGSIVENKDTFTILINRKGVRDESSREITIAMIEIHPSYSCKKLDNDIALMKLNVDLSWIDADPACFPVTGQTSCLSLENVQATVVGWGATNEDFSVGPMPSMLHKVQVPILQNTECESWYRSQNKTLLLKSSQICAGYREGKKDACWTDSGGPLMINGGQNMVVVGVVSTGIGCARASLPGIYTRITEFLPWITRSIS